MKIPAPISTNDGIMDQIGVFSVPSLVMTKTRMEKGVCSAIAYTVKFADYLFRNIPAK
jgi:hypothetical protein